MIDDGDDIGVEDIDEAAPEAAPAPSSAETLHGDVEEAVAQPCNGIFAQDCLGFRAPRTGRRGSYQGGLSSRDIARDRPSSPAVQHQLMAQTNDGLSSSKGRAGARRRGFSD